MNRVNDHKKEGETGDQYDQDGQYNFHIHFISFRE
jgi:hypothetical protein